MISDPAMVRALNSHPQRLAAAHPPGSLLKRELPRQPRERANEAAGHAGIRPRLPAAGTARPGGRGGMPTTSR